MDNNYSTQKSAATLMLGLGIGFVAGIMLAPSSGKDTRDRIQDDAAHAKRKAQDTLDDARARIRSSTHSMKDVAETASKDFTEDAKKTMRNIKDEREL